MAIFVVLAMSLFPTVLCLCRCAGCNEVYEEVEFATAVDQTWYHWNLTHPLCPGLWNGTHYANECACCVDTVKSCWSNVTSWGESGEGTYCTHWHFQSATTNVNGTTKCGLPATINFTGLSAATQYAFNTTYCGLTVSCQVWSLIQLTPLFYIVGVFTTVAVAVVYGSKKS